MVAISKQCPFGVDRAVQISRAIFLIKGHNPYFDAKNQNRLTRQDIRSFLCLVLLGSSFLKIAILLNVLCTCNRKNLSKSFDL